MNTELFETTASRIQEKEVVKFKVKGIHKNVFVEALVIPTICLFLINQDSNSILLSKCLHLRYLHLVQSSMESFLNIDLLIGLINNYDFINGSVIRGKSDEPMALESTLEWIAFIICIIKQMFTM